MELDKIVRLYTHSGNFHADDVFCLAALRLMGCPAECQRVDHLPPNLKDDELAFDIGWGRYDHHQRDKQFRKDGTPYASFGLIVRDFYEELGLTEDEYYQLDMSFIREIDATDNGWGAPNLLSIAIHNMNLCWDEPNNEVAQNIAFKNAVDMAIVIFKRAILRVTSRHRAQQVAEKVRATLENSVVYLDEYAPVGDFFEADDAVRWMCYPSNRGGWSLLSLHNEEKFNKAKFPRIFRGKPASALPKGMTFCHRNGYIGTFDSIESVKTFAANYLCFEEGPSPLEKRRIN